jgi:hypothetical protein
MSGVKGIKKRITYALTTNADGSEKLPPFIIGKAKSPHAFNKKTSTQLGFLYRNNAKAWMTTVLYCEWLRNVDKDMRKAGRQILLLQDNFSGHVPPSDLTNIRVENFSPNLTAHVQPMDAGIIRCFKAHYRRFFMQRALDRYDSDIPPAMIYDINQLEAMHIADLAWREVSAQTVANCWIKSGILPTSVTVAAILAELEDEAEIGLENVLNQLETLGALQPGNRLDVSALVDVPEEQIPEDATDEEIVEAVQKMWADREDGEINGGDDGHNDLLPEPKPTRKEALQAVSTLQKYLADVDSSFARKPELGLATFGRETQLERSKALISTSITDYFTVQGL